MTPYSIRTKSLPWVVLALDMFSMAAPAAAQVDEARIARAAPAEWATYGCDYTETHYVLALCVWGNNEGCAGDDQVDAP